MVPVSNEAKLATPATAPGHARPRRSPLRPQPDSKGKKPKHSKKKIIKRTILVLLALVLIVSAYFAIKIYVVQRNVFRGGGKAPALSKDVDINQLKGEGDGRVNVLLLGVGGPGHEGADLTDTILLASIDPINHQAALLSVPRDLWVKIPGNGSQKINATYTYGKQQSKAKDEQGKIKDGLSLLDQTLSPILGVPIHYHVLVNFQAFKQAVDAVGGVTFDVPEQLYDPTIAWENNYNSVIAPKGIQTFNGARALLYAKSRETSSDFARGQRQRQLIVALKDKVLSLGTFANPLKVNQLLSSFGNNVYTDFSLNDIMRIKDIGAQIPSSSITSIDLVTPPHDLLTTGAINGLSTVQPKAGLYDYADIQNYVRNALKDSFIANENANITILNGTNTPGLATTKAKELRSYGYNVGTLGDAPTQTYQKTVLVAFRDGAKKYTQHYLETRFNIKAVTSLPDKTIQPGSADFVIILGSDAASSSR
jgi:LCP family protein required for cell wall assembly